MHEPHNDSLDLDRRLHPEETPIGGFSGVEGVGEGGSAFAMHKPVLPLIAAESIDSIKLCRITATPTSDGICPLHESDACVSLYVRYNFVYETLDKEIKEAFVRTRKQMQ